MTVLTATVTCCLMVTILMRMMILIMMEDDDSLDSDMLLDGHYPDDDLDDVDYLDY